MKRCFLVVVTTLLLLAVPALRGPAVAADSHEAQVSLLRNQEFEQALLAGIRNARKSITCSYYLFVVHDRNEPSKILDELVRARQRGVKVRVILEKPRHKDQLNEENLHSAALLARGGINVFFDSPSVGTQLKVMVIDGRFVYLGSHNLTQAALRQNNELSLYVESSGLAAEILDYLDKL